MLFDWFHLVTVAVTGVGAYLAGRVSQSVEREAQIVDAHEQIDWLRSAVTRIATAPIELDVPDPADAAIREAAAFPPGGYTPTPPTVDVGQRVIRTDDTNPRPTVGEVVRLDEATHVFVVWAGQQAPTRVARDQLTCWPHGLVTTAAGVSS